MIRVSITGPESTGKTELARQLASYYHAPWVPEVAREYLARLGRAYEYEDIAEMAKEQLALEDKLSAKAGGYLFCDTDILVTKVWSMYKYGKCDPLIEELVKIHRYDLYLLCNTDLPWEEDPLREHPGHRKELFDLYLKELHQLNVDFDIISGRGRQRLKNAISAVEGRFTVVGR